ncbi:MAG: UDP-N-acetylmuramoyl-L-alanine--D-glutamate ligase [Gammaproteobacteria bacterium]|nr:UDP-N-acetylmuramoyl-L-alanine--D-glutamate ligase [Gammaproteobacteria bacterium]
MKLPITQHQDQRYLVVGLGLTGYSVACYLLTRGYRCWVQDDRAEPPYRQQLTQRFAEVEIINAPLAELELDGFDCLVVSPGLSIRSDSIQQAAKSGKRIIGDIELFAEAVDKPVLAITGSNGKSTVTSLVGEMIAADGYQVGVGGNIGVPALELLEQEVDFYVLELSSFQLETTYSLRPQAATVLNISEDHMDRYHDLADYQQTKQSIYRHAGTCISNADDALTRFADNDIRFSLSDSSVQYSVTDSVPPMLAINRRGLISTAELKLKGRHNWANCLAALALAQTVGISEQAMIEALRNFPGLAHRSQWVAQRNGVVWINDSKATNPGATQAAIQGLDEPVILLAGGQSKGADMQSLCATLERQVKTALVFGADAGQMLADWQGCTELEQVNDLAEAVQRASEIALVGDIVLLSPACASFDMYSGFAERGEHFIALVEALA